MHGRQPAVRCSAAAALRVRAQRADPKCPCRRYPLITELRNIYESAWSKPILPLPRLDAYVATHHESAVAR